MDEIRKEIKMKIEQLRNDVEKFMQEMSKEFYMQGAGIAQDVNFDKIYSKYPNLFTAENLQNISIALNSSEPGSDESRKLKLFLEAFYGEILSIINKDLNTQFFRIESGSKIEIDSEHFVPYRSSMIYMLNEQDRQKRAKIRMSIDSFVASRLNPVLEEMFTRERAYLNELGFENKVKMFEYLSGIDIHAVDDVMQKFLKDTEDVYTEYLSKFAKQRLGINVNEMYRDDLLYMMRAPQFDALFPKDKMMDTISGFVKNMGIDISAGENITFDLDVRDNKSPRAFCSPVKIPNEVYLVIYPRGGQDDYTTFLHELGHALHFANVSSVLPFEYKWYGDNSVTEGYAMTFDHLTMKESWMDKTLGVNTRNNRDYFIHRAMNELIMLRRYAAKVNYEIKLNETKGLEGKKELYADIFEKATKVKFSPTHYLLDVDQNFYCVRYLRAWMLQANIHDYMNRNHGNLWFLDKEAGKTLMNFWSMGQKYNADELSNMNGGNKLSTVPLLETINGILSN